MDACIAPRTSLSCAAEGMLQLPMAFDPCAWPCSWPVFGSAQRWLLWTPQLVSCSSVTSILGSNTNPSLNLTQWSRMNISRLQILSSIISNLPSFKSKETIWLRSSLGQTWSTLQGHCGLALQPCMLWGMPTFMADLLPSLKRPDPLLSTRMLLPAHLG